MYAVIELQGHQYIVQQGDEITVDRLDVREGEEITAPVLLSFTDDGSNVNVGAPYIDDASVVLKVVTHQRGEKIHVTKFKRKNRYARKMGFRSSQTVLSVSSL